MQIKTPVVRFMIDGSITLLKDYTWVLTDGSQVTIGREFNFDGASIPRLFWRIVGHPFQMPLLVPALVHDALYSAEWNDNRGFCDWEFICAMQCVGICWIKRNLIWSAVKLGGWAVWNAHKKDDVQQSRMLYVRRGEE